MIKLLKRYGRWARRSDELGWRNPPIAVAPVVNGSAAAHQVKATEEYLSDLRAAAVRRGVVTVLPAAGVGMALVVVLDLVVTSLAGLL